MTRSSIRISDPSTGQIVDIRQPVDWRDRNANWRSSPPREMRLLRTSQLTRSSDRDAHPRNRFI
jgi:hypothetical protein